MTNPAPTTAEQAAQVVKILSIVQYLAFIPGLILVILSQSPIFPALSEPLKTLLPFLFAGLAVSSFLTIRFLVLPKARKDLEKLSGADKGYKE